MALRHLFACLLLVLLPFQVMAATHAASEKPVIACAHAMMADMDCCDDDGGGCAPANCLGMAAVSALPASQFHTAAATGPVAAHGAPPYYPDSHIPDRLQRPPLTPI